MPVQGSEYSQLLETWQEPVVDGNLLHQDGCFLQDWVPYMRGLLCERESVCVYISSYIYIYICGDSLKFGCRTETPRTNPIGTSLSRKLLAGVAQEIETNCSLLMPTFLGKGKGRESMRFLGA